MGPDDEKMRRRRQRVLKEPARLAALDALRGLAASAVVLYHLGQYYDVLYPGREPSFWRLFGPGHFGVELFFIISGFVILMTIERKNSVLEFATARVARLMPTFVAVLLIASVVLMFSPMPPLVTPTLRQFLANLTMAPSLFEQPPVDLPYWTLTYELLFYVAIATAMRLRLMHRIEWLGLLALAVSFVLLATVDLVPHRRISIVLMVHYSNFFLIGICLFRIHAGKARPVTYFALACAVAITARGGGEQAFYAPGHLYLPLTAAFAALVWLATSRHGKWLTWRPLLFLGGISYPLYLAHVVLGYTIIRFGVDRGWSTTAGVLVAGTAAVAVAVALHYLVEVPGGQWSRASLRKLNAERPRRELDSVEQG